MGRYSYDDMPPEGYRERRESGRRGTFIIAFVGILLTLIAIVLYLLYTPHQAMPEEEKAGASTVEVSVPEPEILQSSITKESDEIDVLVDNRASLENVQRFGRAMKKNVSAKEEGNGWRIEIRR